MLMIQNVKFEMSKYSKTTTMANLLSYLKK